MHGPTATAHPVPLLQGAAKWLIPGSKDAAGKFGKQQQEQNSGVTVQQGSE